MRTRELLDVATMVAAQGRQLIVSREPLHDGGLEEYWTASKCRLDRWGLALRRATAGSWIDWPGLTPLFEQVLASEMLTRAWAAVLAGHDQWNRRRDCEPIGRSVLIGHLEARHRVLQLLVHGRGLELALAQSLSVLCRRTERWTDLLVGYLSTPRDVSDLAFSAERAERYRALLATFGQSRGRSPWVVGGLSLAAAFERWLGAAEPNLDLNARIAGGIFGTFPEAAFDDQGLARSLWLTNLQQKVDDTSRLCDWLEEPAPNEPGPNEPRPRSNRFLA